MNMVKQLRINEIHQLKDSMKARTRYPRRKRNLESSAPGGLENTSMSFSPLLASNSANRLKHTEGGVKPDERKVDMAETGIKGIVEEGEGECDEEAYEDMGVPETQKDDVDSDNLRYVQNFLLRSRKTESSMSLTKRLQTYDTLYILLCACAPFEQL